MGLQKMLVGAIAVTTLLVGVLALPAGAGAAAVKGAAARSAPAGTLDCSHPHSNLDTRSGPFFDGSGVNIRTGPHKSCLEVGQGQLSDTVDYHCWTQGESVNGWSTWTFLVDVTTGKRGWVNDGLLDYRDGTRGSNKQC